MQQDETRVEVVQGEARARAEAVLRKFGDELPWQRGRGRDTWAAAIDAMLAFAAPPAGERDQFDGAGFVYWNPDSGEEYAPNHPFDSGECVEAERVRRSTPQEDTLHAAFQEQWKKAQAPSHPLPADREAIASVLADRSTAVLNDYRRRDGLTSYVHDENRVRDEENMLAALEAVMLPAILALSGSLAPQTFAESPVVALPQADDAHP